MKQIIIMSLFEEEYFEELFDDMSSNNLISQTCREVLLVNDADVETYYEIIEPDSIICDIIYSFSTDNMNDFRSMIDVDFTDRVFKYFGSYDGHIYIFNNLVELFNHVEDENFNEIKLKKVLKNKELPYEYDEIKEEHNDLNSTLKQNQLRLKK